MTAPEYTKDTIVAAATPPGVGGVAVVRVSGPDTEALCQQVCGTVPKPRYATLCEFRDHEGQALDNGVALYFPAPNSFTGESVLELHGHGGPFVVNSLVEALVAMGARRATHGEFSKRAYLNDKLDLVQAEAISDLIGSSTTQAARAALRSLSGTFSSTVNELLEALTSLRLYVEAALDFPEEEVDFLSDDALQKRVDETAAVLTRLEKDALHGRILRDGFQMVIVGRPNAGKSSLLNLLSGEDAAIVTEVAGTTRDILRERIDIDGLAVELVDTAGLRNDPDRIEAEGIRRARDAIRKADAILWIQDSTNDVDDSITDLEPALAPDMPVIRVRNKTDASGELPGIDPKDPRKVNISAKTGEGEDALRTAIRRLAGYRDQGEGAFTARRRHVQAIRETREHFDRGCAALKNDRAGEIFAEELRLAQNALGEITGSFSSDDLLGKIFSEFCIGK